MNINENIRNKSKMVENLKGCTYNITHVSAANYSRLPEYQMNVESYFNNKVSKGAKIRNRYNQVPQLTQDTNRKVTNSQ